MLKVLFLVLVLIDSTVWGHLYATCKIQPNNENTVPQVTGVVTLTQNCPFSPVHVKVSLEGFTPNPGTSLHGFHIHEYGDITGGCGSAGGHYNPSMMTHGAPGDETRHVGDFGNIRQTNGKVELQFTDRQAILYGPFTVIGRAIVIHAGQDDLGQGGNAGSLASGNAGPRLACCVIGVAKYPPQS